MHAGDDDTTGPAAGVVVDHDYAQTSVSERIPGRLTSLIAIGLGLCVSAVNIALAIRLWKTLFVRASSGSLIFSLIILSFALGVFLIAYGIILARSRTAQSHGVWCTSVALALLLGVAALAITVWAATVIDPVKPLPETPKACIDLYQQALPIHQASPSFRFPATEPDQRRCDINSLLKTIGG
jgi:hypothetical protein